MKRITFALAVTCLTIALSSFASATGSGDRGTGIGVILGEPTGFSFKHWTGGTNAIDGAFAWSFSRGSAFHIHVDYLWHSFDAIPGDVRIPLYYGIGGRLRAVSNDVTGDSKARLGLRGVVGLDFLPRNAPIDVFVEIAPIMDFVPATDLSFNAGIGIRFWFE